MQVDGVDEPDDPASLDENFQPPADFRDRRTRLMTILERRQQPSNKQKPGLRYVHFHPRSLQLHNKCVPQCV